MRNKNKFATRKKLFYKLFLFARKNKQKYTLNNLFHIHFQLLVFYELPPSGFILFFNSQTSPSFSSFFTLLSSSAITHNSEVFECARRFISTIVKKKNEETSLLPVVSTSHRKWKIHRQHVSSHKDIHGACTFALYLFMFLFFWHFSYFIFCIFFYILFTKIVKAKK